MTKLLLDEHPLVIIPSLAEKIGLNEAIVLQQLHYWLEKSTNVKEEKRWVYNTYGDWVKQFPFWSETTIRRTITKLEKEGYIQSGKFNKMKIDNTKWYTIDYNRVEDMNRPPVQNGQTEESKWTDEQSKMDRPITRDYTETTTENKYSSEFEEFWSIYPRKLDKKKAYKSFHRPLKEYGIDEILKGTRAYAKSVKGSEAKFIKHASTFLNNDSFIDGYEEKRDKPVRQQEEIKFMF